MKVFYIALLCMMMGCVAIKDPRHPLIDDSPFVDFQPIVVTNEMVITNNIPCMTNSSFTNVNQIYNVIN